MYVIARRIGETVKIANGLIELKVINITGNIVRLGFEAPEEIDIVRVAKEIHDGPEPTDIRES